MKRFTAEELEEMRRMWASYVPVPDIARKFQRSPGTVRQAAIRFKFPERRGRLTRALKWAPAELRPLAFENPEKFMEMAYEYRREKAREPRRLEKEALMAALATIDPSLPRKEKIRVKRAVGATLQMIGDEFGVSRERIRQICLPRDEWLRQQRERVKHLFPGRISHEERRTRRQRIIAALLAGTSVEGAMKKFKVKRSTIVAAMYKAGYRKVWMKEEWTTDIKSRAAEVTNEVLTGVPLPEVAAKFGISQATVRSYMYSLGFQKIWGKPQWGVKEE